MQIEYWIIAAAFIAWLIITIAFIAASIRSNNKTKKLLDGDANKNKTVFFVEHNPLQWEDVDFSSSQYPTIVLPEGNL